jgi:hypothetical protein
MSRTGHRREHRTEQHGRPAAPGEADRGRGDVHSDGQHAPLGQREDVTPRAAAHVEDGAERAIEDTCVGGFERPEPLLQRNDAIRPVFSAQV